jgi:hypothetical protein
MADRHVRGGRDILDEPSGKAIAAWAAGPGRRRAGELARPQLNEASRPGQAGEPTADAADAVHGDLLMSGIAGRR